MNLTNMKLIIIFLFISIRVFSQDTTIHRVDTVKAKKDFNKFLNDKIKEDKVRKAKIEKFKQDAIREEKKKKKKQ